MRKENVRSSFYSSTAVQVTGSKGHMGKSVKSML